MLINSSLNFEDPESYKKKDKASESNQNTSFKEFGRHKTTESNITRVNQQNSMIIEKIIWLYVSFERCILLSYENTNLIFKHFV